MLNTIKPVNKNFTLFHLDYNEILLDSIQGYFFNINSPNTNPFTRFLMQNPFKKIDGNQNIVIKGVLHITSNSLFFEPSDINLPLFKLKYFTQDILSQIFLTNISELEPPQQLKSQEIKAGLIANAAATNTPIIKLIKDNNTNVISKQSLLAFPTKINEQKQMKRYDEKFPIHVKCVDMAESLMKSLVKKGKDKNTGHLSNRDYNSLPEIKALKIYFSEKGFDYKVLFENLIKYLNSVQNKDRNHISYSFCHLKSNIMKIINRAFFKKYQDEDIQNDSFIFLIEGSTGRLQDFKDLALYMNEGLSNSNDEVFLVDHFINKIIVNKIQEMEKDEKDVLGKKVKEKYNMNKNPKLLDSDSSVMGVNFNEQNSNSKNNWNYKNNSININNSNNSMQNNSIIVQGNTGGMNNHILISDENTHSKINEDIQEPYKFEYYLFRMKSNRVLPEGIQTGLFIVKDKAEVVFLPISNNYKQKILSLKLNKIKSVLKYRYIYQYKAIKIILFKSGREKIFEFESFEDCNEVYNYLIKNCPNLDETYFNLKSNTHRWVDGLMSNFDYLIFLNSQASRSFCDLSQYPIFPWVINDYTSETIDLSNDSVYRDLSKPIGYLSKSFPESKTKFEHLKAMGEDAYFYGMHYSNPQIINHFLIRAFPQLIQNFENGSFGSNERIFNSIKDLWDFIMTNSSDLRELIPEFYSGEGEFLVSHLEIELDNGKLDSLKLPKWAKSHKDFIDTMKSALESDYVSNNLHHWIDLIFGYKSSDKEAEDACNLFHPNAYEDYFQILNYNVS